MTNAMWNNKVAVLMSIYSPDAFFNEQINSIISQEDVEVHLFIRNDGSNDIDAFKKWKNETIVGPDKITFLDSNENLGPGFGFLELTKITSNCYDYYCFADQDDFWESRKLIQGIRMMRQNKSSFYFGSSVIVDKNGREISKRIVKTKFSLTESFFRNNVQGATIIFNNDFKKRIKYPINSILMHDEWLYKIALLNKTNITVDSTPYLMYRKHDNNYTGNSEKLIRKIMNKIKILICPENEKLVKCEARQLWELYKDEADSQSLNELNQLVESTSLLKKCKVAYSIIVNSNQKLKILYFLEIIRGLSEK